MQEREGFQYIGEEDVKDWMDNLARYDHFIEPETALALALWWEDPQGPMILEGPPGGGKTSLAEKVARLKGASFYKIPCSESLKPRDALYSWNKTLQKLAVKLEVKRKGNVDIDVNSIIYQDQMMVKNALALAITDRNPYSVLLLDEMDKLPNGVFEGVFLEALEKNALTIPETGKRLEREPGKTLHIFVTSNAGTYGLRDTLSQPVLRRGGYIYIPEPVPVRQYAILRTLAPRLSDKVARQCVLFVKKVWDDVNMDKSIALSETIMWAKWLQRFSRLETLTHEVVEKTIFALAKGNNDRKILIDAIKQILVFVQRNELRFLQEILQSEYAEYAKAA